MKALVITFVALAGIFLVVASFASLRPATREVVSSRTLDAPPAMVQATLLDTSAQSAWRSRSAQVEPAEDAGWTEVTKDGERITSRVLKSPDETVPLTFQSQRGDSGLMEGRVTPAPRDRTVLEVREEATTPSPVGRILSRLFLDPEAFAKTDLDDLAAEVARRQRQGS